MTKVEDLDAWPEDWPMSAVREVDLAHERIAELERKLAEANRRIGYLLRVSGLGRIEAVDELIRREAGEVGSE